MPKKFFVAALGLFLVLGLLHLGMKVHDLEHRLDTLERGGGPEWPDRQAAPKVRIDALKSGGVKIIYANYTDPADDIRKKPGRSEVGVPWEIDRGMMMDAHQHDSQVPANEETTIGTSAISGGELRSAPEASTMEMPREILQNLPVPR